MRTRTTSLLVLALALGSVAILARPARSQSPPAPQAPTPTAASSAPRISFPVKEMDFGKVVVGTQVERSFPFRNAGTAPLEVRRVKASCGCTAALSSKSALGPGESGAISVRFDTTDRHGFQAIEVRVFTNDTAEKDEGENISILRLRGEVTHVLSIMPLSFYFPDARRGSAATQRVTVLPNEAGEVKALSVETGHPWLRATLGPFARGPRKGFEVALEVAKDAPIGRLEGRIEIRTDSPTQPLLRLPLFGAVQGRTVVFPDRLDVNPREGEKEPVIHLLSQEGALAVEAVEAPPQLEATLVDVLPGKRAEIALKVRPGAPRGPFAGLVRIFFRDADQPVHEVQVVGEVPRRVRVEPGAAWLEGKSATARLLARAEGGKVTGVSASGPFVATLEPQADGGAAISIALAKEVPSGPLAGTITLATDVPGEERVEVPVRARVEPSPRGE